MTDRARALAELVVRVGANVQPGQILAVSSEPGKEDLARAVAEVAYEDGAVFVDLAVWDVHFKRARMLHADPDTLGFVPPWYSSRMLMLGENRCARIGLAGPVAPHALDGIEPDLIGRDHLPAVRESAKILNERTTNWSAIPVPTPAWAQLVHPQLDQTAAFEKLSDEIAHVCRVDEDDPVMAWRERIDGLLAVAAKLDALRLDSLRYEGPGTSLTVGLMPSSKWVCGLLETVGGIVHVPNLPTEEVFTTPDPERVDGVVSATKPLYLAGVAIEGLRVRFEGGVAVEIDADDNAGTLRTLTQRDGGGRLGEVALVDRKSRIGQLGTVFYDTLLDENAASHLALGQAFAFALESEKDIERMNNSEIHVDFMIGSDEITVTGVRTDGSEVPLLRGGEWQI